MSMTLISAICKAVDKDNREIKIDEKALKFEITEFIDVIINEFIDEISFVENFKDDVEKVTYKYIPDAKIDETVEAIKRVEISLYEQYFEIKGKQEKDKIVMKLQNITLFKDVIIYHLTQTKQVNKSSELIIL